MEICNNQISTGNITTLSLIQKHHKSPFKWTTLGIDIDTEMTNVAKDQDENKLWVWKY